MFRFDFIHKETGKVLGHADTLAERVKKANMKRYKNCIIVEHTEKKTQSPIYTAITSDNNPDNIAWNKGKAKEEFTNFTDALAKLRIDGGTLTYKN